MRTTAPGRKQSGGRQSPLTIDNGAFSLLHKKSCRSVLGLKSLFTISPLPYRTSSRKVDNDRKKFATVGRISHVDVASVLHANTNLTSISAYLVQLTELARCALGGLGKADCSCSDRHVKPPLTDGLAGCGEKGVAIGLELRAVLGHQFLVSG